jgi:DNA-binding NtrC family response regulator
MELNAMVLIVDDDPGLRLALRDRLEHWGCQTTQAADGQEALAACAKRQFDLVLLDLTMPGMGGLEVLERLRQDEYTADVVVLTAHGSVSNAVKALQLGATDFLTKPADFDLLAQVVVKAQNNRRLQRSRDALADRTQSSVTAAAPAMLDLLQVAERAAGSDATVVLGGESGSGKQVVAEFIHAHSKRRKGPFVYVNCVAISEDLVESTLFGHERGAFTGAVSRKPGRLECAAAGTAFLDEIGDIGPGLQAKLLHFLEVGEFERVGGNQTVRVDCRIIAATNKDLAVEVKEGRFREDLYYRLNVITLKVPPLRERPEDVPLLADFFLGRFAGEMKRRRMTFAPRTMEIMKGYAWPGNVRQLKNAVERMTVLAVGDALEPELLPPEIAGKDGKGVVDLKALPYREAVAGFKTELVERSLRVCGGNQTKAAEMLGLQRSYLNRLMKDLGLRGDGTEEQEDEAEDY